MLFTTSILLSALTLAAPQAYPRVPSYCNGQIVKVQQDDTAWSLINAIAPGTPLSVVAQANPQISDLNVIFPGDKLCIPTPGTPPNQPRKVISCTGKIVPVVQGDTTYKLVQTYAPGEPIANIQLSNPHIRDLTLIYPGDELCIPIPAAIPCTGTLYTIKKGDSMFNLINIGQFKGISLNAVKAANPRIANLGFLTPGQQVCFPGF